MNKVTFPCFFAILFMVLCYGSDVQYYMHNLKDTEELRLSYALDYCTDAAVDDMLNTDDLGTDYKDLGNIKVNPTIALDTFLDYFMLNYNMSMTQENREYVMSNFMPTFVVAGYDGYYIAKHSLTRKDDYGTAYDFTFGPKLPYTYTPDSSGVTYALNMGGITAKKLDVGLMSTTGNRPPGLNSKDEIIKQINDTLTNSISAAISEENENDEGWSNSFYLPSNLTTFTGAQPVTGPSVLSLVQNVDIATGQKVSAFSIAGSRINLERMIAGYFRNGQKYYSYVDSLPPGVTKDTALDMFTTATDAARAGYRCDVEYFE